MLAVVSRASGRKTAKMKLLVEEAKIIIQRKLNGEKTAALTVEFNVNISTINRIYRQHNL